MDQVIEFAMFLGFFVLSFLLSLLINHFIIKISKKQKVGQIEREYLSSHKVKNGTPSLGGISIIFVGVLGGVIASLIYGFNYEMIIIVLSFLGFAMIGFIDDWLKLSKKNVKGLNSKIRLLLELIISLWTLYFLGFSNLVLLNYQIEILNFSLPIGYFAVPIIVFMLIGGSNASNLADGLDGLSSGLLMLALFPFLIISIKLQQYQFSYFLLSIIGGILGFLVFNMHPAKIFMGDVGSLSLGALIVLSAIFLDSLILIPIAMVVFIIEAISVIIQVLYFKKTHRRVFLMTPLHHHYEKKNVPEYRIVMYFWLIGIVFSIIACFLGGM